MAESIKLVHKSHISISLFCGIEASSLVHSMRSTFHVSLDLLLRNMVVSRVDVFHIASIWRTQTPGAMRMFFTFCAVSSMVAKLCSQKKMKKFKWRLRFLIKKNLFMEEV